MTILLILTVILIVGGIVEYWVHCKNLKCIPIRIHVNGTRGKSTTVRLIAGGLREAGLRVLAKTTGSTARVIFEDGSEELIKRRSSPNIIEQKKIVKWAAQRQAEAVVVECMAIHPEMQWISEHHLIRSTIGVITNVRQDHLDQMGSALVDIADTLALTIPEHGELVTAEKAFFSKFSTIAQEKNTTMYMVNHSDIADDDMQHLPRMVFRENIACALKVCNLVGVPRNVALRGMQKAIPDPGATKVFSVEISRKKLYLINAFAANDLSSTRMIWELWRTCPALSSLQQLPIIGLFNNRSDRGFRVKELAGLLKNNDVQMDQILLIGQMSFLAKRYLSRNGFERSKIQAVRALRSVKVFLHNLQQSFESDLVLFGFGNIKGPGQTMVTYFEQHGEEVL